MSFLETPPKRTLTKPRVLFYEYTVFAWFSSVFTGFWTEGTVSPNPSFASTLRLIT
jgi:hypothetical protein